MRWTAVFLYKNRAFFKFIQGIASLFIRIVTNMSYLPFIINTWVYLVNRTDIRTPDFLVCRGPLKIRVNNNIWKLSDPKQSHIEFHHFCFLPQICCWLLRFCSFVMIGNHLPRSFFLGLVHVWEDCHDFTLNNMWLSIWMLRQCSFLWFDEW